MDSQGKKWSQQIVRLNMFEIKLNLLKKYKIKWFDVDLCGN